MSFDKQYRFFRKGIYVLIIAVLICNGTNAQLQSQTVSLKNMEQVSDTGWIKKSSSYVEYDFYTFSTANAALTVFSVPTHPLNNRYSMRYAVSVDGGPLQVVDFRTFGRSDEGKQNVLRNRAEKKIKLPLVGKGKHRLRIYAVDPGVILDGILIDLGGLHNACAVIPETKPYTTTITK